MHVSRFNYVSDHSQKQERLVMNFLTQSADIVEARLSKDFTDSNWKGSEVDADNTYLLERGYLFSDKDRESQILEFLYEHESKHAGKVFVVRLDDSGKNISGMNPVYNSICELMEKHSGNTQPQLILFNERPPETHIRIQELKDFLDRCHHFGMVEKLVTTPETLSFYKPLLSRARRTGITLISSFPSFRSSRFFPPETEEILDHLIEHETNLTMDLQIHPGDVPKLKSLINFFIYKGWPMLDNFKCRLVSARSASCFFGYCHDADTAFVSDIFREFKTHGQTEFFSMEKWVGIRAVHGLIWQGRPPRPLFHFCEASRGLTVLNADGARFPCLRLAETVREDIRESTPDFDTFREWNVMILSQCSECRYAVTCGGGCTYHSLTRYSGNVCCPPVRDLIEISLKTYFEEFQKKTDFLSKRRRRDES